MRAGLMWRKTMARCGARASILMDAPHTVTANFAATPPAVLSGIVSAKSGPVADRLWSSYHVNGFQMKGDQVFGSIVLYYDLYRASPNDVAFSPDASVCARADPLVRGRPPGRPDTIAVGQIMSAPRR